MFDLTRREWLIQSLSLTGAAFVAQLPPQFSTPATPPCDPSTKPTPGRTPIAARPSASRVPLTIEGAVIGIRCGFVAGAVLEFSIGGARERQVTNADGRYTATILVPKPVAGSPAPRVNIRVDVPKKTRLTTYLFLPDEIAHAENAKAPGFDPLLRMTLVTQRPDAIHASFDVILDL